MSPYWLLACVIFVSSVAFFSERYGEDRVTVQCDKHDEAQQQVTIKAENHVNGEIITQAAINQGVENDFQKTSDSIATLYTPSLQPSTPATSSDMRTIPTASITSQASKKYKLTPQQCDVEEAKFNALWKSWVAQAALK